MTDITHIPLSKLIAWEGNARRVTSEDGISELAASIQAHGLLQSLVVKKDGKKFAVVAGNRRLTALQRLAKAKSIKADYPVPCQITDEAKAAEVNLAENTIREDMHPADQFEAFRNVIDQGKSITDVAAAFGVTEEVVRRRMKLAQVSPAILQAYRDDKLTLEHIMAFAISDDHEAQERLYDQAGGAPPPQYIRRKLSENEVSADDARVGYVTLKAYENAGGALRRDLFSDDETGTFISDVALLDRLVSEKLDRAAKPVQKEGWKWVETRVQFAYGDKAEFQQVPAERAPLPPKLAKEVAKLQAEYDKLVDDEAADPNRLDEIDARLEEIDESREAHFTTEQLAIAGAVVTIGDDGKAEIVRGLVRPEDMPKKNGKSNGKPSPDSEADSNDEPASGLSAGLIEDLTAQKSAAISAAILGKPDVALAGIVHAMASQIFAHGVSSGSSIQLSVREEHFRKVEGSKALAEITAAREKWEKKLPGDHDELWNWCLQQKQPVLLDLLTCCSALIIHSAQTKQDTPATPRLQHAQKLAAALGVDMTQWFTPTAENYFSRIAKPQILQAIQEANGQPPAPTWEKLKKADLAKEAERQIVGKGWIPEILR